MRQKITLTQTTALLDLQQQFTAWRESGRVGKRIPEELWDAATDMARQVGVNRVSKAAALDYSKLKRRLNGNDITQTNKPSAATGFVQLPMDALVSTPQCVIEFAGHHGLQTMHLSGYDTATIVALAQHLAGIER